MRYFHKTSKVVVVQRGLERGLHVHMADSALDPVLCSDPAPSSEIEVHCIFPGFTCFAAASMAHRELHHSAIA